MLLTALYINDHFLFDNPIVLNFGGKYLYDFDESSSSIEIKREINKSFIQGFFDSSNTLINVAAIVGANGSGKTTLLNQIINSLIINRGNNIVVFEDGEIAVLHNFMRTKPLITNGIDLRNEEVDINTVFYSPFLDFKPEVNGVDLSFDNLLRNDLGSIFDLKPPGGFIRPIEILRQANHKRIRNLKISQLAKPIKEIFDFPDDDLFRISFTRYGIEANTEEVSFHNTPMEFQSFLNNLFLKIRKEADNIRNSARSSDEELFTLQKNLLKNYILMDIYCILIKLMEIENTYLQEGHFDLLKSSGWRKMFEEKSAFDLLILWLNESYYSKGNRKNLPHEEINELLKYLYSYINAIEYDKDARGSNYFNWNAKSIFLSSEKLDQLYRLEQNFINSLAKYYLPREYGESLHFETISQIPNYINLEPSSRNLSSGETAMLNLFSRIHDYFDNKIIQIPIDKKYDHYLLLLDEADLGYHPRWKRSFVNVLIRFAKEFFELVGTKVQIIFTTHDALTLSDLPSNNINYIENVDARNVIPHGNPERPNHSFGANITDLLADSFYLEDGLIGDFAKNKIQETLDWLNNPEAQNDKNYHKVVISLVDEPILKTKLEEMYFNKFEDEMSKEDKKERLKQLAARYGMDINFDD